jgi:integrase/recombinase XerD
MSYYSYMIKRTYSLLNVEGSRKYLTETERKRFLVAVKTLPPKIRTYCLTVLYTGGRRAEVLNIRKRDVDRVENEVAINSIKKRVYKNEFRRVPVPSDLIESLDMVFDLGRGKQDDRLWKVTPRQAARWVDTAFKVAGIDNQSVKTLRHTFGITCVLKGVPLTTIQDMLGHEDLKTTAIYSRPMGEEKKALLRKMWEDD